MAENIFSKKTEHSTTQSATGCEAINLGADSTPTLPSTANKYWRGIWVGVGGTVKVDLIDGGTGISFVGVPAGTLLPLFASKIYSTGNGTTASSLVGLY